MAAAILKERKENKEENTNASMDAIVSHLNSYGNQLRDYLNHVDARVEGYRFAVEKKENGVTIDVSFKAFVGPGEQK